MSLETIASKYEFPNNGGLFVIIGPQGSGKSSIISKPSLLISKETSIKIIETKLNKFLLIEHRLAQIVLDEINPRFYKNNFFKNLLSECKEKNIQIFIILKNLVDLPSLIRTKTDYWFLFKLDNTILGFSPLNKLSTWVEPEHDEFTAIVAQFKESGPPNIWWFNSKKEIKKTKIRTIKIVKDPNNNENITDIQDLLKPIVPSNYDNDKIWERIQRNTLDLEDISKKITDLSKNLNEKFDIIYKKLEAFDAKMESIMYDEDDD